MSQNKTEGPAGTHACHRPNRNHGRVSQVDANALRGSGMGQHVTGLTFAPNISLGYPKLWVQTAAIQSDLNTGVKFSRSTRVSRAPAQDLGHGPVRNMHTGKPMDTSETNGQTDGSSETGNDFGRRNPLEIGVQLRNLVNRGDFLTAQYKGGQLVTRILDVDVRERTFTFDWGALAEQNQGLMAAPRCLFHAQPDGVRVEFSTSTPRETRFEGRPAFEADFPEVLFYVQRREFFRVDAPVLDPYICTGRLPSGERFTFEVHDLSLGGVGMRSTDVRVADLPMGCVLEDCELSLGSPGKLSLDLQLVSFRAVEMPNHSLRYQLGLRFVELPGNAENTLQRLITQLEMKRRSLVRT
jgi:flagellar brake protein